MNLLSENSQRLFLLASEEASTLNHGRFGTGHLAIAILRYLAEDCSDLSTIYSGILDAARDAVDQMWHESQREPPSGIGPSENLKAVLADANGSALARSREKFVQPSDLLTAMTARADCIGTRLLEDLDVPQERLMEGLKEKETQQQSSLTASLEVMAEAGEIEQFTASRLERVVLIDQKSTNSGITMALTALEVYLGGAGLVRYLISASHGEASVPNFLRLTLEDMRVQDQSGHIYRVALKESSAGIQETSGMLAVFGPLDGGVEELCLNFGRMSSEGIPGELLSDMGIPQEHALGGSWEGPWTFRFSF